MTRLALHERKEWIPLKAVIFGAGKIARGFLAHLLHLSDANLVFFDVNKDLVTALNREGAYRIQVMDNPHHSCEISGFQSKILSDVDALTNDLGQADICFTAVGGKNLEALGAWIAPALEQICAKRDRENPLTIVTCENWTHPADVLWESIVNHLPPECRSACEEMIGVTEAVIMRSGVDSPAELRAREPLTVMVQDYWTLPINADRVKGQRIPFLGAQYLDEFAGFLERKFYTYNAANGTVSFLGYLKHHELLSDAATDSSIETILDGVYQETGTALVKKYNLNPQDQRDLAMSSKVKLQNRLIVDYVERNARDPIRKLGVSDRLVGPARLALAYGIIPENLATAIAAALYYDHPADPVAIQLRNLRLANGVSYVLTHVSQLDPQDPLHQLICAKVDTLRQKGWIQ